ncbi:Crp/Fnr family transcriptional regulator [Schinkia sp. CFF1]
MKTFFENFPSSQLSEILYNTEHVMKIKKGTYLCQEGMPIDELYIVKNGWVMVSKISHEGKELALEIYTTGDIIGVITLFTAKVKHLLNAKVLEDGEVYVVKKEYLEQTLMQNSDLAVQYIKWMNMRFQNTQTKLRHLILYGKKGALYSTIIRLANKYGVEEENGDIVLNMPLNNQELAYFCGTSRETVNRMLKDLSNRKVLSVFHRNIIIHNPDYLRNETSCGNCPLLNCCTI